MSLGQLLSYLDARRFTAVVAQMLDFFSDRPLCQLDDALTTPLEVAYPYWDPSGIVATDYHFSRLSYEAVKMHLGGIRRVLFGTNNGLTKVALVLVRKDIQIFQDWHHAVNARVADFTCVLRHYPFTGVFYQKGGARRSPRERYGWETTDASIARSIRDDYRKYWEVLAANPDLCLRLPTARRDSGTAQLLEHGFLVSGGSPGSVCEG